jgi:hypothetical protein
MFSGILAPETAAPRIDWKWCAEIEPFPCSVIAQRKPGLLILERIRDVDEIQSANR